MRSIWETGHFHRSNELVVVGGGITGLFTALFHKRRFPHHHVLVLERGAFPNGASVRNAGFACFGSPSELLADKRAEGLDAMLHRVEERWQGLVELRAELGDANIGFVPSGGHEVFAAHDPLYTQVAEGFDDLNKDLSSIFGKPVFRWNDAALAPLGLAQMAHLAHTELEGALDSGALMRTLLRKCIEAGVLFRGSSAVLSMDETSMGVALLLIGGEHVMADQVVLATNGFTRSLLPEVDVIPARGQVVLTSPIPGLKLKGTFHLDEGFYYFRDLLPVDAPDGSPSRVLLGGGRNLDKLGETTDAEGTTPEIQQRLEELLRTVILPGKEFTIEQRWSGTMGFRANSKTPLVERRGERIVVAAGLSGMGVAIGIRVARKAAGLLAEAI